MVSSIGAWVVHLISSIGYPGIILTMVIESALVPLPSEIIMPFSGYLASTGHFNFLLVSFCGAVGNLIGALLAYALGYWGHERIVRRFIRRWGRWLLISERELDKAEKVLNVYKDWVVLGSRVAPGVRTVISLPCGIARLPLWRFVILTFFGSLVWSAFLAGIGYFLGKNWESIQGFFHKLDLILVLIVLSAIGIYIFYKLRDR